jgi:glycosyltransferase involved in cell wall biosynthesis
MKILLLKSHPHLSFLEHLARGLKKRGHEVHILVPREHPDCVKMRNLDIPVHINSILDLRIARKRILWKEIGSFVELVRFMKKNSFDVISLNLSASRLFGRLASLFLKKSTIVVSSIHAFEAYHERLTNKIDDGTVAATSAVRRYLVSKGIPQEKITVIHYGIDIEALDRIPEDKYYLHRELGLDPSIKLIGMVAHFYRVDPRVNKGHKIFLDAAKIVSQKFRNIGFVIVGTNRFVSGYKERFESYTRDLDMQDKVYFLGERFDIPSIMSSCYANVLPSLKEGFGMVLLEAMARRIPNIASRLESISEIIKDKETGLLLEPGNHCQLSEYIISLLNNPEMAREIGLAGRKRLESHFTAADMARKYEELFRRLLWEKSKR